MITRIITQSGCSWLWLIGFAFLEGIFRRIVLEPRVPGMLAELLGIAMVLVTGTVIAYQFSRRGRLPQSSRVLLLIGGLWVFYTIAFEFLFFHFLAGVPLSEIADNYDVTTGHLFPIGLAATFFVPLVGRSILRVRSTPSS
ncbi:hypothetical protein U8335_15080 [Roseiconus lacunae]|uniref:hypothetical protein n=1 Tax=Roseiconus lacunae TaxID=2605694 RepID=UPI00308A7FF1|nr:hypothetical protein U8335_15080 [Stieleria sp. HD01]